MKILYAVPATGNGHIARAMTLLPHLRQYGPVDIFLSGDNYSLPLNAPIRYRSRGISLFYNHKGGLDYRRIAKNLNLLRIRKDILDLPVEQYDLVLNDFDFITSTACRLKRVPSIHFGHQASFQFAQTPRPAKKQLIAEWLMQHYVRATHQVGLHFLPYAPGIFPAILGDEVLNAQPMDHGHITVYLPAYPQEYLKIIFQASKDNCFHIFSKECKSVERKGNLVFHPVDKNLFSHSLVHCHGLICGAGFETPAEALHLGKKLLVIPIRGHYEQLCNAAAVSALGAVSMHSVSRDFHSYFMIWLNAPPPARIDYSGAAEKAIRHILSLQPLTDLQPDPIPALPGLF